MKDKFQHGDYTITARSARWEWAGPDGTTEIREYDDTGSALCIRVQGPEGIDLEFWTSQWKSGMRGVRNTPDPKEWERKSSRRV